MTVTRISAQSAARAGAVALLEAFKADFGISLQIHRARPRKIAPPTAFVDGISEDITYYVGLHHDRRPVVTVLVLHGQYDYGFAGEAADQRDAFVDAFFEWVLEHRDALDPKADMRVRDIEDEPAYVPDWLPVNEQPVRAYYATRITLEGFATSG